MTSRRTLLWIFVAALVLRLAYVFLYPQFPFGLADDSGYDDIATSVASGGGFTELRDPFGPPDGPRIPTVEVPPVYPAFLAGIYTVFGHNVTAVRAVQAVFSALLVLVAAGLAREVTGSAATMIVAALLTAVYPAFIFYNGVILGETLFTFLLAVAVWMTLRAIRDDRAWRWALAGVVMAAAVLIRSEALAIVPLLMVAALWNGWRSARIGGAALFIAAMLAVIGVWTVRNYRTFDEFVMVSANGGRTLWISAKGWDEWRPKDPELQRLVNGLTPLEVDHVLNAAAKREIVSAPFHFVIVCLRRIPQFWLGSHATYVVGLSESFRTYAARGAYGRVAVKALMLAGNTALLLVALAGALIAVTRRSPTTAAWMMLTPIVAIGAVHVVYFATSRYQVPIMSFVIVFAAVALTPWNRVRTRPYIQQV